MSDDQTQYTTCMFHGAHHTRIKHLEDEMTRATSRLDVQDKRMDQMAVEHAKLTGKIVGLFALAQMLLQVALEFIK